MAKSTKDSTTAPSLKCLQANMAEKKKWRRWSMLKTKTSFFTVEAVINYQNDSFYNTTLGNIPEGVITHSPIAVMVWLAISSDGSKSPGCSLKNKLKWIVMFTSKSWREVYCPGYQPHLADTMSSLKTELPTHTAKLTQNRYKRHFCVVFLLLPHQFGLSPVY